MLGPAPFRFELQAEKVEGRLSRSHSKPSPARLLHFVAIGF